MLKFDIKEFSDFLKTEIKTVVMECFQSEGLKLVYTQSISNSNGDSRYLTRKQVSKYLGIGLSTVDYWVKIGKLKKIVSTRLTTPSILIP